MFNIWSQQIGDLFTLASHEDHSAGDIFHLSTGIFRKDPLQHKYKNIWNVIIS